MLDLDVNANLARLRQHPDWAVLKAHFLERQEMAALSLANTLLSDPKAIDQRRIDEQRGYWLAIRQVLGTVDQAEPRAVNQLKEERRVRA